MLCLGLSAEKDDETKAADKVRKDARKKKDDDDVIEENDQEHVRTQEIYQSRGMYIQRN